MTYTKVVGSDSVKTSSAQQDIGLYKPENETYPVTFKKFQFMNYKDCTVSINNGERIFLPENCGMDLEMKIKSFVINESGVNFIWVGGY